MQYDHARVVAMPGGVVVGEGRFRDAVLRPLNGREEELLAATGGDLPVAHRVTAMLGRCLVRLGPFEADPDRLRALTVGDREALLLHLRRATLGERIDCVLSCPDPVCGERLELDLRVGDLLLDPYAEVATWHQATLPTADGEVRIRFRLPTGGDQEAVAELAAGDPQAAAGVLLERCIDRIEDATNAKSRTPETLDEDTVTALGERMAKLDPQAEIRLQTTCPACRAPIEVLFDTAGFFFAELTAAAPRLYEEIHTLASHYHWGPGEILDLTTRQRHRYLALIAASLDPSEFSRMS